MKNKKVFMGVAVVLAVLVLGIGYAAISNVGLQVTTNTSATPEQANFKVKFLDGAQNKYYDASLANKNVVVDPQITGDLSAGVSVSKMSAKGEKVTTTFTIENSSEDLSAGLSFENDLSSYQDANFKITADIADELIAAGETTTVTVTFELLVTPILEDLTARFDFKVVAEPLQPVQP